MRARPNLSAAALPTAEWNTEVLSKFLHSNTFTVAEAGSAADEKASPSQVV